jgi:aspartate racemase
MDKTIGIVGGMGTYASIDLLTKIANNTEAGLDQDHLPVTMISEPELILDRTEYLLGHISENPGYAIAKVAVRLSESGADLIGLPCNTAHVPGIIDIVLKSLPAGCRLINMIEEVGNYITQNYKGVSKVGVLATNGTYGAKVYDYYLKKNGIGILYPDEKSQFEKVHPSIYDPDYGLKAQSNNISDRSVSDLFEVARELISKGAEVLILGCTEIPLAITESHLDGVPAIDASNVLAKALVRESRK